MLKDTQRRAAGNLVINCEKDDSIRILPFYTDFVKSPYYIRSFIDQLVRSVAQKSPIIIMQYKLDYSLSFYVNRIVEVEMIVVISSIIQKPVIQQRELSSSISLLEFVEQSWRKSGVSLSHESR